MAKKTAANGDSRFVLTAVREAGFSFQSPYFMQSEEFANLIGQKNKLSEVLEKMVDEIVEELFQLIKDAKDEKARQQFIVLKRSVYNRRQIPANTVEILKLPEDLQSKLLEYGGLSSEKNCLFEIYNRKIAEEIEQSCAGILENENFRASLEYSCPALSFSTPSTKVKFSKWLRKVSTVYAYALKHITKTPPFFTFSLIYLPASKGVVEAETFETVLNTEVFSELENSLVNSPFVESFLKFEMVTNWRGGGRYYFLIFRDNTVKLLHYPATPLLEKTVNFFNERQRENYSVNDQNLPELFSGDASSEGFELLDNLKREAVVFPYLIENVQSPADGLIEADPQRREIYENLRTIDGQIFRSEQICAEHREITKNVSSLGIKTDPSYIGYGYAGEINSAQKKIAAVFAPDLLKICDIFRADHNNTYNRATTLDLIKRCFESSGKTKIPYLELLTRVVWLKVDEKSEPPDYYEQHLRKNHAFQEKILNMKGSLSAKDITNLVELLPDEERKNTGSKRNYPMCFVGAVDFQTPSFYLHNVFSGNERFTGKYLTRQNRNSFEPDEENGDVLNVEILPLWSIPQHRVKRSFRTGFSFDLRTRRIFNHFVAPEDIDVILEKTPVFIHRVTGKRLNFFYRGLALFQSLPIPYKLLLFDQIDFFINFFAQTPPRCGGNETVYLERLNYQNIILRRSCFCIGIELLKSYIYEKDWIRGAYLFREHIKKTSGDDCEYFYFRLMEKNGFTDTPRFLNLLHPLSWDIFRRSVLKSPETDAVHLTRCSPAPSETYQKADGNHLTEFMIEV